MPVGGSQTFPTDIVNTGTTAETVTAVTAPGGPVHHDRAAAGHGNAARPAVSVTVTYKPTDGDRSDAGSFTVTERRRDRR